MRSTLAGSAGSARLRAGILSAALLCLLACGTDPDAGASGVGSSDAGAREPGTRAAEPARDRQLVQLVALLTAPAPEEGKLAHSQWLDDMRAFLASVGPDDADLGSRMITHLRREGDIPRSTQRLMIEAIARSGAPEAPAFLADLVLEYGADLGVRAKAAEELWRVSPEGALETLEPLLRERPRATTPPGENLLAGWLAAKRALDEDPSEVLALVATDLFREDAVRIAAVRALGECRAPIVRATLEAVLVESTGNFYLRRIAAQTVFKALETEEACALIERVLSLEADMNMQVFLADLFTRSCP